MNDIFEILKQTTDFESLPSNVLGAAVSEDIIITQKAMDWLINEQTQIYAAMNLKTENEAEIQNADIANTKTYHDRNSNTQINSIPFIRLYMQSTVDKSKQYCMRFDNKITNFDNVYKLGKINIVIDRKNLFYFMGVIIDYVQNEQEIGFVFLDTDDQKVSDYYLLLAKGQEWLDYTDATIGNTKPPTVEQQTVTSVLYQDDIYSEEAEPPIQIDSILSEKLDEGNLQQDDMLYTTDAAEDAALQEAGQTDTKTVESNMNEQDAIQTEDIPTDIPNTSEAQLPEIKLPDIEKPAQSLDIDTRQLTDHTRIVPKRAITGIHFQY